jgi:hypothetical protein
MNLSAATRTHGWMVRKHGWRSGALICRVRRAVRDEDAAPIKAIRPEPALSAAQASRRARQTERPTHHPRLPRPRGRPTHYAATDPFYSSVEWPGAGRRADRHPRLSLRRSFVRTAKSWEDERIYGDHIHELKPQDGAGGGKNVEAVVRRWGF